MANTYSEKLRDPRWQRRRLEIMQRDDFSCRMCYESEHTLNVHHLWYTRGAEPWDYPDTCLITTCEACHEELHAEKFGEKILAALIAGGGDFNQIYELLNIMQAVVPGAAPNASALVPPQWDIVLTILAASIAAVQGGMEDVSAGEISRQLKGFHR